MVMIFPVFTMVFPYFLPLGRNSSHVQPLAPGTGMVGIMVEGGADGMPPSASFLFWPMSVKKRIHHPQTYHVYG